MTSSDGVPLRNLLDAAPDGFVVVNSDGSIVWANQTAHELFGYRDVELLGRPIEDLIPERLFGDHTAHRADYQVNPRGRSMGLGLNLLARKKDGTEFPVEISLSPLHTREGLLVTAIVRDISERKALEEERNVLSLELETERERDRIAMDLHDGVMQDIYAVALGLELALDAEPDGRFADAKVVERSIGQLHDVIRSIRSFIFDLRPRQFSGSLSESLTSLAEEFNQNSQIETEAQIEAGPDVDPGISMAIYHIAHEGLSNVQKHAGATRVAINLSYGEGTGCLKVIDDGAGFDADQSPPEGHHGMRNMASRARAIDAEFRLESISGEGTTLSVTFPLRGG